MGFTAAQLAANDTDPTGDELNIVDVGDTSNNGTVTGSAASGFTFTPRSGFVGQDTIEYLVVDPDGHVGVGTIYVQVLAAGDTNQAPVARRDVERTNKGVQVFVDRHGERFGSRWGFVLGGECRHAGARDGHRGGSYYFYYTPEATFSGTETITYTVRDSGGLLGTGTVTVWVDTSETGAGAPTPQTDYFVTTEDTPLGFTAAQLAANDTDPTGEELNIVDVGDTSNNGTVTGSGGVGVHVHAAVGVCGSGHD